MSSAATGEAARCSGPKAKCVPQCQWPPCKSAPMPANGPCSPGRDPLPALLVPTSEPTVLERLQIQGQIFFFFLSEGQQRRTMIPVTHIPVFRASIPSKVVLGATLSAPKSRGPHMASSCALCPRLAKPLVASSASLPVGPSIFPRYGGVAMASWSRIANRSP